MARDTWRKLRTTRVPLDKILCGSEYGMTGEQLAIHTGDMSLTSTPIAASRHVKFLQRYLQIGESIFNDQELKRTEYYIKTKEFIDTFGWYFSAFQESQIVFLMRNFIAKFKNENPNNENFSVSNGYSQPRKPVTVWPIKNSDCYQIADGHHKAAIACAKGLTSIPVRIIARPQQTNLQRILLSVNWNVNKRELYQPINSPELGKEWPVVRRCTDRLAMMKSFLSKHYQSDTRIIRSYCDLACYYGWFTKEMQGLGYQSQGVEIDVAARMIGRHFYGLKESQLIGGDVVKFLESTNNVYDVVSCFSLMHHFVMGRGTVTPEHLIELISGITRGILFFDMGQETEEWFKDKLKGWNPTTIKDWLLEHGSFSEVTPLGIDSDRVEPYEDQYGRTLFACVKYGQADVT